MKKIFISQKMNGKSEDEIKETRRAAEQHILNMFKKVGDEGEEIQFIDSYFEDYDPQDGCKPLKYLAKSLELLADADFVYFADDGYKTARGCYIEYYCATAYGIPTMMAE